MKEQHCLPAINYGLPLVVKANPKICEVNYFNPRIKVIVIMLLIALLIGSQIFAELSLNRLFNRLFSVMDRCVPCAENLQKS